ncbi:hypothetical protein CDAR_202751 [Caerostris darwini]|uniref:BTB domain-containing protein n=1 Tax=Caerostris darwini TaxID=1538125 RepID=A0AAV4RMR1_9ARAC|nr:hypothetical protein CDAR_202751 [Caerostris darwini]
MACCKAEACNSLSSFQVHRNTAPYGKMFPPFVAALKSLVLFQVKLSMISGYCDRTYSDLKYSMDELFNDETFADVTIVTDGHEFRVHKAILSSRSMVFHDLLSTKAVRNSNRIVIEDLSEDTVREMLRFVYTGSFLLGDTFPEVIPELLHAAHSYKKYVLRFWQLLCTWTMQSTCFCSP